MRQLIITFAMACTIVTTCFGMLTKVSFQPYIQLNPKVEEERKNETYRKNITLIGIISENNEYYRCFQYALEETTGFTGNINFYSSKQWDIPINDFFQQIPHPKIGCLVVYTDDELNAQHFAVAIDSMNFKSKFGQHGEIYRHELFQLDASYKDHAYFLELLPKYENDREQLHQDLEKANLKIKRFTRATSCLIASGIVACVALSVGVAVSSVVMLK